MTADTITIDCETAALVRLAFLPLNPNKLRAASPEVKAAAKKFIDAVERSAGCQSRMGLRGNLQQPQP